MAVLEFPRRAPRVVPSLLQRLAHLWELRRERAQLLSLTERELKDIGLTRYDAMMEARRPFWKD
ncbi:DUF1127 domain-containing protein [Azospirillum soli]|uniref:DUF1127 domain-containing protein n=1 Tax=Azospirillum soli TaxID=1304799 RepID=UPI001AE88999|nr:DUF1127 domain-containing protein [Azospirillum soli]MBP2311377.1 uncharacterized protein YjiS (DUF1127 family) [Azospirillum soli]